MQRAGQKRSNSACVIGDEMAFDVTTSEVQCTSLGVKMLVGNFTPANGASPTVWAGNWIESVVRGAEGVWTITMKARFRSSFTMIGAFAQYLNGTTDDGRVVVGATDLSAGTIVLNGYLTHTADDLAANTPKISVMILCQSTGIKDGTV